MYNFHDIFKTYDVQFHVVQIEDYWSIYNNKKIMYINKLIYNCIKLIS